MSPLVQSITSPGTCSGRAGPLPAPPRPEAPALSLCGLADPSGVSPLAWLLSEYLGSGEPAQRPPARGAAFGSCVRLLTQLLVHVDPGGVEPEEARAAGERGAALGKGPRVPGRSRGEPRGALQRAPGPGEGSWPCLPRGRAAGAPCAGPAREAALSPGCAPAGGQEGRNKEAPPRVAAAQKPSGLWGIVRCWRGVVQQQVGLGAGWGAGGVSGTGLRVLTPPVPFPAGAAVPGGGGAGARCGGAVLRAVPAPARRHGGALRAAGCLRGGPGPGLRGGVAAALLPRRPARESRQRGAGTGPQRPSRGP